MDTDKRRSEGKKHKQVIRQVLTSVPANQISPHNHTARATQNLRSVTAQALSLRCQRK